MVDDILFSDLLKTLKKKSFLVLLINIISTILIFLMYYVLTNNLTFKSYSNYNYVITILSVLALICSLGFEISAQRFIPKINVEKKLSKIKTFIIKSFVYVFTFSMVVCGILNLILLFFKQNISQDLLNVFYIGSIMIPSLSLLLISSGILKGLKKPVISSLPKLILKPLIIILIFSASAIFDKSFNAFQALGIDLFVTSFCLIIGMIFIFKSLTKEVLKSDTKNFENVWLKSSLTILCISILQLLIRSNDIIILGAFHGTESSGAYSIATRIAILSGFGLIAINSVIPAFISKYFARNNLITVQKISTFAARLNFTFSLFATFFIIYFENFILNVFGSEFLIASNSLKVLCIVQLFNSMSGSVGFILIMTGNQKSVLSILIKTTFLHLISCLILIPKFELLGASIATGITIILTNLLLTIKCVKKIGVDPTILGFLSKT